MTDVLTTYGEANFNVLLRWQSEAYFTLMIASAQVVETSVRNNSPSQDSSHSDDHFQSRLIAGPREARNPNLDSDQRIAYYACAPCF